MLALGARTFIHSGRRGRSATGSDPCTAFSLGSGQLLVERLGPGTLEFRLVVREGTLEWVLEHIEAFGIALPLKWFRIAATIKARDGRYHFVVDSELIGVGRIVRYEGLLDAAA